LHLARRCEADVKAIFDRVEGSSRMAQSPETYTRTISTMSEVLDALSDEPDPDGSLSALADRIAVEREWVRTLMALGEEPHRPPRWLRRVETPTR
jgi:hypothetical protein